MIRYRLIAGVALAVCALAAATTAAGAASSATRRAKRAAPPARMLVYAQEWSLYASRASAPSGTVIVQLWDRGQDAHDVRIRHIKGHGTMYGKVQGVPVTQSGRLGQATWHLRPGHYELYCSLPGHRMRGMHTTLVVR